MTKAKTTPKAKAVKNDELAKFEKAVLALAKTANVEIDSFIIKHGFDEQDACLSIEAARQAEAVEAAFRPVEHDYEALKSFDEELATQYLNQHGLGIEDGKIVLVEKADTSNHAISAKEIYDNFFRKATTCGDYFCKKKNGTAKVNHYFFEVLNKERQNLGLNDCLNFVTAKLGKPYNSSGHFTKWQHYLRKFGHKEFVA